MTARRDKSSRKTRSAKEGDESAFGIVDIRDVPTALIFRFQFGPALLEQLRNKLKDLPPLPLAEDVAPPCQGSISSSSTTDRSTLGGRIERSDLVWPSITARSSGGASISRE